MSVTINAKGTSVSSFMVGKAGTTITQSGTISPPSNTDFTIGMSAGQHLRINAGASSAFITTTGGQDLHINPTSGGGQYLVLVGSRWPTADGTNNQVLRTNGSGILSWATVAGTGTVTTTSVVSANGFAGTVATATTTPAITLSTTVTGVLKGNGTAISAATQADFAPNYAEYVATAAQTIINTSMTTLAKASGKSYLQVYVNGVFQQEGNTKQFTVTGENQITFNVGLNVNDDVVIYGYA